MDILCDFFYEWNYSFQQTKCLKRPKQAIQKKPDNIDRYVEFNWKPVIVCRL